MEASSKSSLKQKTKKPSRKTKKKPHRNPTEPPDEPIEPLEKPTEPPQEPIGPPQEPTDPPQEPPKEPTKPPQEPSETPQEPTETPTETSDASGAENVTISVTETSKESSPESSNGNPDESTKAQEPPAVPQEGSQKPEEDPLACKIKYPPLKIRIKPLSNPVIPRAKWGAKMPRYRCELRKEPIKRVLCESTNTGPCDTEPACVKMVQDIQTLYLEDKGEDDMPYNFVIGGDGQVYEGRGWKGVPPMPRWFPNSLCDKRTLSIGLIGKYGGVHNDNGRLSEHIVYARRYLMRYGEENELIKQKTPVVTNIVAKI